MRIPQTVIDEVARRIDIVDLVSDYVQLTKKGSRLWGLSPFKTEKTPSFSVDPDKQLYYCFSTQQGGTAIHFFMTMEGIPFPEAIRRLAERAGVTIQEQDVTAEDKRSAALFELYERVAKSFAYIFWNSPASKPVVEYMFKRGFSETILKDFQIGYCPADPFWLYSFLVSKGYSEGILSESGLFTKKNQQRSLFSGRIMFPITDDKGRVVAFGGRSLDDKGPKYLNSPETVIYSKSRILYGLWKARQHIRSRKAFIVVEGYMDVLAMHQADFPHTVAPLGTAFTSDQISILSRFAQEGILLFDSDTAGYNAILKAAILCEKMKIKAKAVQLTHGSDPADLLSGGGLHALQNSVSSPVHVLEYLYTHISSRVDTSSVDGVHTIIHELTPYLSEIVSAVQREASYTYLGERMGIDPQAIRSDIGKKIARDKPKPKEQERKQKESSRAVQTGSSIELFLMIATIANINVYPYVRRNIEIDDLQDHRAKELYIALEEGFRNDETSVAAVIERIDDTELKNSVLQKLAGNEYSFVDDIPIKEAIQRLREANIRRRRHFLQQELQTIRGNDIESMDQQREIMAEIIHLDTILRDVRECADEGNAK